MEATIIRAFRDDTYFYLAVWVNETDGPLTGRVEYIAGVLLTELEPLTLAQKKARLVEAVRARRTAFRGVPTDMTGLGTTVTL